MSKQTEMFYIPSPHPDFPSALKLTEPEQKGLGKQLERVKDYLSDGEWHTVEAIMSDLGIGVSSADKQPRNLRMEKFGGHTVEMRRKPIKAYKLILKGGE